MLRKFPHNLRKFVCEMDLLAYSSNIQNLIEILKNHLYFAILTPGVRLKNTADTLFFNVDDEFTYANYYFDFGPLNISCLYKYCCKVNRYLYGSGFKRVVHCTTTDNFSKANAAYLIGSYAVIFFQVHPEKLAKALVSGCERFLPFNDASIYGSYYKITLLDCFWAVRKANHFGFFNFSDFDEQNYDTYNKLQNGDVNWILPNKFLAFISPSDMDLPNYHPPEFYIQYFIQHGVKAVIRLNNETYNPAAFTSVGIEHHELYFPDGTTPPKKILLDFLKISETTPGAIAIHCKAGLGRTGSLIGAYMIKHYLFHAKEAIAWLRICRPGSVIGAQQGWLETIEPYLRRQGYHYRFETYGHCDKIPKFQYGIYSKVWNKEREKILKKIRSKELEDAKEFRMKQNIPIQLEHHLGKSSSMNNKPSTVTSKNLLGIPQCNYQNEAKEHIDQGEKLVSIKARGQNRPNSERIARNSVQNSEYSLKKEILRAVILRKNEFQHFIYPLYNYYLGFVQ